MIQKISVSENTVRLSKELCSEIIPPRKMMRALLKEYEQDYEYVMAVMVRLYGLPFEKLTPMYFELMIEKEKRAHYGRPKALTDAHRAFIEQYRDLTGKVLYEHMREYMDYTGSLKTVQNELTRIRNKHRIDF